MKGFLLPSISLLISILLGLIISGCSLTKEEEKYAEMVQRNAALQEKNTQLTAELAAQSALTTKSQIKLLEKDAEINRLASIQQELGREMVRNRGRIHTPKNKAEAVTLLAEAETDINAARELTRNSAQQQSFNKSDQLMTESKAELDLGNYDRACTLAAQALELIQTMQLKRAATLEKSPVSNFHPPLSMQLAKRSNIRKYPDIHAPIVHILEPGMRVTATSYQGHWIKVTIKDQPSGWIYYSLLIVPEIE
jgi:hypothetical protein